MGLNNYRKLQVSDRFIPPKETFEGLVARQGGDLGKVWINHITYNPYAGDG